jgi:hypothetical protein
MKKIILLFISLMVTVCFCAEIGKLPMPRCKNKAMLKKRLAISGAVVEKILPEDSNGNPDSVIVTYYAMFPYNGYGKKNDNDESIVIENVDLNNIANDEKIWHKLIKTPAGGYFLYVWPIGTRRFQRSGNIVILKRYTISPDVAYKYYTRKK